MKEIDIIPIGRDANKPGSADWRMTPENLESVHHKLAKNIELQTETVSLGAHGTADVSCDDGRALEGLVEYFNANMEASRGVLSLEKPNDQERPHITYLVGSGLRLGRENLGQSGLPYEGIYDSEGKYFVAVGRNSIGTFKSLVIGAISGIVASETSSLPVHSAIVASPDGKAVAISGRGNTGKTTTLLAAYEELINLGYGVLTDDWAFINENTLAVTPVDFLAGIREDALPGLHQANPTSFMSELIDKMLKKSKKGDKNIPLAIQEIFGEEHTRLEGILTSVIFTSTTPISEADENILFEAIEQPVNMGKRLRSDAYHAPEIPATKSGDLSTRYGMLSDRLRSAYVYTRAQDQDRLKQVDMIVGWILEKR